MDQISVAYRLIGYFGSILLAKCPRSQAFDFAGQSPSCKGFVAALRDHALRRNSVGVAFSARVQASAPRPSIGLTIVKQGSGTVPIAIRAERAPESETDLGLGMSVVGRTAPPIPGEPLIA